MTHEAEYDIRAGADRVVAMLEQRRYRDAMNALEAERQDRPLVVQESLDRFVANHVSAYPDEFRRALAPAGGQDAEMRAHLDRVMDAKGMPRFPGSEELTLCLARFVVETPGLGSLSGASASNDFLALPFPDLKICDGMGHNVLNSSPRSVFPCKMFVTC